MPVLNGRDLTIGRGGSVANGATFGSAKNGIGLSILSTNAYFNTVWNGNPFPPPPSGSVLYLPGYPGQGSVIKDYSVNPATGLLYGNNGTIYGATWVGSPSGLRIVDLDADDYISIPSSASISFGTGNFTVEWYAKHPVAPSNFRFMLGCGVGTSGWVIMYNAGLLTMYIATTNIPGPATIPFDTTNFYQGVFTISRIGDQCTGTAYKNGALMGTKTVTTNESVTTATALGFWKVSTSQMNTTGQLGIWKLYNITLSASQIAQNWARDRWLLGV